MSGNKPGGKARHYVHSFDVMKAGAKAEAQASSEYSNARHTLNKSVFDKDQDIQNKILQDLRKRPAYNSAQYGSIEENEERATPNPFYHAQRKKLLMRYQKQLLEKDFEE